VEDELLFTEEVAGHLGVGPTKGISPGELVSVLFGPCADVRSVVLGPLPDMVAQETIGLVSVGRERFVEQLVSKVRLLGR